MSIRTQFCPPPPTWRLCHPVNIYVYQNGLENTKPCLVHIPMEKKKNMTTVLEEIGSRMKLTVGYPVALYHMDGSRVCKTYELEMYNNYVVVTNLDKRFKCVDYGKERMPLVVIGRCSKHVNTLRLQNKRYDLFCRAKMRAKPLHELMAASGDSDGLGPDQIAVTGTNCGALCHKPAQSRTDRPTQCCSDEIMCVEGESMGTMDDSLNDRNLLERAMERRQMDGTAAPPSTQFTNEECRLFEQLQNQAQCRVGAGGSQGQGQRGGVGSETGQCGGAADGTAGPLGVNKNLVDLMIRYKDVGSDIFRLFQDKIQRDKEASERMGGAAPKDTISDRWQIPGESNLSLQTEQRVKNDLMKLAQQTCQFTFDQKGNFLFSDGCRVGEGGLSNFQLDLGNQSKNFCADVNQMKGEAGDVSNSGMVSKGEGTPGFVTSKRLSIEKRDGVIEGQMSQGYTDMMGECDEMDLECQEEEAMERARRVPSQKGMDGGGSGTQDPNSKRVGNMQSEISQIVGNVRRSSGTKGRSNSYKGGRLSQQQKSNPLETLVEEEEDEGGEGWGRGQGQVNASGSGKINVGNSNSRGQMNMGNSNSRGQMNMGNSNSRGQINVGNSNSRGQINGGTGGYDEEDEEDDFVEIRGTNSSKISNKERFLDTDQEEDEVMRRNPNGEYINGSKSYPSGGDGWNYGGDEGNEGVRRDPSGGYVNSNGGGNYNGDQYDEGEREVNRGPSIHAVGASRSIQGYNGGGGGGNNLGDEREEMGDPNNWGDEEEGMVRRDNSGGFVTGSKSKTSNKSNTSVGRNGRGGAVQNNRNSNGEQGRNNTRRRNDANDEYEDDDEYYGDGGGGKNVFSVFTEFRNPFREGRVPPLAGKLHKDRLDKLFAENPFRKHYFHCDDLKLNQRKEGEKNELIFLRKNGFPPEEVPSTISLPPPPETAAASPPIFGSGSYRTEYWLQQRPDVFLQQINKLVQRHDNTKATSPPPPLPPGMSDSQSTFTIGPGSPRSSRAKFKKGKKMVNAACGPSTTESRRGVSAQVMAEIDKAINDDKWADSPRKPKCLEGGTQTTRKLPPFKELPSEDEKPAGIYEGYQESIKLKDTSIDGDNLLSENDGDDERKVHYRKRKENRRLMRKRKERAEHYLHPVEEEEDMNEDDHHEEDNQLIYISTNQLGGTQPPQQRQIRYISQTGPYLSPSQHQQHQPFFVQTSSASPTALPLVPRNSTQVGPVRLTRLVHSSQQPLQFPIQIVRPQHQQVNMIPSSSPLIRQPIIFTTTQPQQQQTSSQQAVRPKFLPTIASSSSSSPQNTSMRLIRIVAPNPHQQLIPSAGGVMQNKLVQMAPFQPVFPAPHILRPQPQQQPSPQTQLLQQFILK